MKKEEIIKCMYAIVLIIVAIVLLMYLFYSFSEKLSLVFKVLFSIEVIFIGLIIIRDMIEGVKYNSWYKTNIIINIYLFIFLASLNTLFIYVIINTPETLIGSYIYTITTLAWLVLFISYFLLYNSSLRYKSCYFKILNNGETDKIMTDIFKSSSKIFKEVTFEKKKTFHNLISLSSNKDIIKIKSKSILIHSFDGTVVVCGKKEKNVKEILKRINKNVMSNIEI